MTGSLFAVQEKRAKKRACEDEAIGPKEAEGECQKRGGR